MAKLLLRASASTYLLMPAFQKALLLYNPVSGTRVDERAATLRRLADLFRHAGVETRVEATRGPGSAGEQARGGIATGADAVIACGGDGTVFDVLQGVAESRAALGVLPLGTGNVLAHDLGLATRPERAAAQLLDFVPRSISLGRIQSGSCARYFTVAAGVGVHAELLYRANAMAKRRGGFLAYYNQGLRLLLRRPFTRFPLEITTVTGETISTSALELLAMRVRSFGGPLSRWRPGSSLLGDDLRLVLLRNSNRASILRYALQASAGVAAYHGLEREQDFSFLSARRVVCHAPEGRSDGLRLQADGELLGSAPAELSMVPRALTLLVSPLWQPSAAVPEPSARR